MEEIMTEELDIFDHERLVVDLKNAMRSLQYAAWYGFEEAQELGLKVKEVYLKEREKCMKRLHEMNDRYPDFDL